MMFNFTFVLPINLEETYDKNLIKSELGMFVPISWNQKISLKFVNDFKS